MGVYYELNEHIDMNPLKFCQAYSDKSLEYQQEVVWLQMAQKAKNGSKWSIFKNTHMYVVWVL